jgi:predicted MFS family arabinose efflux permease
MNETPQHPVKIALAGLLMICATMAFGRFCYTPILPFMVEQLHITVEEGGSLASSNYAGYLIGAITMSKASLPGSRRTWVLVSLALSAMTTGAMALTTSLAWFLALRFIAGFTSSTILVFGSSVVLDALARARRPNLMWIHFAGVGVGVSICAALIPALGENGFDWAWQWAVCGALGLVCLGLVAWLIPGSGGHQGAAPASAPEPMDRRLIALIFAYGCYGFGYVIMLTFISAMLRAEPALRSVEPMTFLILGLAAIPSVAFAAWIGRKIGFGVAFAGACLIEAVGTVLCVAGTNLYVLIAGAVLIGFTFNGLGALGMLGVRSLTVGDARRNLGLLSIAQGVGQISGPIFAGYVWQRTGSFVVPSLAAALMLSIAAGLPIVYRRKRLL